MKIPDDNFEAGSLKAIWYAIIFETIWKIIDEVWHSRLFDWFAPRLHYRFCQWSHRLED